MTVGTALLSRVLESGISILLKLSAVFILLGGKPTSKVAYTDRTWSPADVRLCSGSLIHPSSDEYLLSTYCVPTT